MRVTGIGEILWDELPSGRVLGGAPFNVTAHLARLGHHTAYLTAVGDDQPGQAAVAEARARGIDTALIQVTRTAPTGTARVTAGASGATTFQIARPAAFENIRAGSATLRRIAEQQPDALACAPSPYQPAAAPPPCGSTGRPLRPRRPPSPSRTPSAPETGSSTILGSVYGLGILAKTKQSGAQGR